MDAADQGIPFGRYRLRERLGHGGMGEVFAAYDTHKECEVAIKRLRHDFAEDEGYQVRFRREAQLAARLRDPHVIPIHDFGEIDGQLYIEMRLVDGIDLEKLLRRGSMAQSVVLDILDQAAGALDAAHAAGLVHRDVKPSNIVLSGPPHRYFAYLVDFGVARPLVGHGGSRVTATVGTVGTLAYLAPERIEGLTGDRRADVYSLSCVLFECLGQRSPFLGEAASVLFSHVHKPPPRLTAVRPDLPPAIDDVIARGMAKSPDERYPSAGGLISAARAALSGAPDRTAGPPPTAEGHEPTHVHTAPLPAVSSPPPLQPPPQRSSPGPPPPQAGRPAAVPPGLHWQPQAAFTPQPFHTPPPPPTRPPAPRQRYRPASAVLTTLGAIACVLAFTVLPWYRRGGAFFDSAPSRTTFPKLRDLLSSLTGGSVSAHVGTGVSKPYFAGLAWGLLAVAAVLALLAAAPLGALAAVLRVVGTVVAIGSAAATILAVHLFGLDSEGRSALGISPPGFGQWLAHASFGPWAAVGGFLVIALGAVLGPRRA